MRRMIGVSLGIAVLAVPSAAAALSRVLHGPAGPGASASIDIQFRIQHGQASKITRLELNNIPASCKGYSPTAVSYSFPHHILISHGGRFHAKDVLYAGEVTYTVRGHFLTLKKATGTLRVSGTVPGCRSADSGVVSSTATATS